VSGTADLLAARPDLVNARGVHGNSPLLIARYSGKHDIVRFLLERAARASFFEACALGLVADVRRQLRESPALVGQWAHDGWPALHLAAFFGRREIAQALLASTATCPSSACSSTVAPIARCAPARATRRRTSP
jgi:ankyrin repeat protein